MHYKKRKLHKLHSIPIGLCNKVNHNRLYLVSYSIPLSLLVVLLLGLGVMVNPGLVLVDKSSAVTIRDEWVVKENNPVDDTFGGFDGNEVELSQEDQDAGISLQAASSAIGITITNTDQVISTVQGGSTAYGNYDVRVTGNLVNDYALSIRAASANLTMPSGASSRTSTISGVGSGTTGTNMSANRWGYAITDTSNANYASLTYKTTPTTATNIANGNASSSHTVDVTKRLVFAAKFGNDVTPGTYSASITLSATATPADLTGLGIWANGTNASTTSMQGISSGFCKNNSNVSEGDTIILTDSRDGNQYRAVKLKDGQCWMQENLKLGGSSAMNLTSSDTDLASGTSSWQLPASSDSSWSSSNTLAQIRVGKSGMTVSSSYPGDGKGWQSNYGNYYSWCAATAGSCSSATSSGAVAGGSICPKNWHLPTGNTNGEFYNVLNGLNFTTVQQSPYLFPAAGRIDTDGLRGPGTYGYYWSSTAGSDTNAYDLYFYSSSFYPGTASGYRYYGYSVRCVADY